MARVKRSVNAKRSVARFSSGPRGIEVSATTVPQGQGAGHPFDGLRLRRPSHPQGDFDGCGSNASMRQLVPMG